MPYDPSSLELLAQIIDRARTDNGTLSDVSRPELGADLANLSQLFSATTELPEQTKASPWDMIQEEHPLPTRRYKIFAKALTAKDPLAALRKLSRDRSPSELYLLQVRINSRARSKLPSVEKDLPNLKAAEWSDLSQEQQSTIYGHMKHLEHFYRRTESKSLNPMELQINEAVHELAQIFSIHTLFDGIDTDLPYSATSWFVEFVCLALVPFVDLTKLTPDAISTRWGRLKGSKN